jgi:apolipoprotein N-acyltransferase
MRLNLALFNGMSLEQCRDTGWMRSLILFGVGCLLTISFSPISFWASVFVCFPVLMVALKQSESPRDAFVTGWWFGFGHFVSSMYWISFSFGVDLKSFAWLIPFTVFGLPFYFALYPGLAAALCHVSSRNKPLWVKAFLLALLWTIMEFMRGIALTGFPWNLLGYAWSEVLSVMQVTSLVGAYGLSFLTIVWATVPFVVFYEQGWRHRPNLVYAGLALVSLLSLVLWGISRTSEDPLPPVPGVHLRLVQPNIPQKLKMDHSRLREIYETLLALSIKESAVMPTHVIWPEAALSINIQDDEVARYHLARAAPRGGYLLLGATRRVGEGASFAIFNSFFALSADSEILNTYDKSHLVPFGEYIPLRFLFPKNFKKLTLGAIDFSEGDGVQSVVVPGVPPVSPLICYEGIFPGNVVPLHASQRPGWMLNLTNDAWFGNTFGPYQHLAITRARAIEEGMPLVRVANTGISAVIDPFGRILESLPLNETGIIDATLPLSLTAPLYARFGFLLLPILVLCYATFVMVGAIRSRRSSRNA